MKRIIIPFLFVCCLLLSSSVKAQDLSQFEKHWYISNGDTLPYRVLLPKNYEPTKKYPLVYFLHGAGERGRDNEAQLIHGAKLFLREDIRNDYPAIVVFPQCPQNSFWSNVQFRMDSQGKRSFEFQEGGAPTLAMKLANELLTKLIGTYLLDKKRLYIGGLSMGGMGTFELVRRNPGMFAAAFPICGGGATPKIKWLKKTNWWVFHGAKDNVVPQSCSDEMVAALKKLKAEVRYTVYPNANHNSWDPAFAEKDLLKWLFGSKLD